MPNFCRKEKIPFYNLYCYLQVHPLFGKAESKNKLLRSVAGGGVEQIGQLQARWDKFEMMMESHELMVKEQVGKATFQPLALLWPKTIMH